MALPAMPMGRVMSQTEVKYRFVTGGAEEVGAEVTELLNDGWKLVGAPFGDAGQVFQAVMQEREMSESDALTRLLERSMGFES